MNTALSPDAWLRDVLMHSTDTDNRRFVEMCGHLSVREETTPYHCGPHSIRCFEMMLAIAKPKRILEIGFNLGHSANMMLALDPHAWIMSLDIRNDALVNASYEATKQKHGLRFSLCFGRNDHLPTEVERFKDFDFDTAFIDGGHLYEDVDKDIKLCKAIGCQWFFLDDWLPEFGPGVIPAAIVNDLYPLAIFGNMALCRATPSLV